MGVNLWGEPAVAKAMAWQGSPLYVNPVNGLITLTKVLAEGNLLRKSFAGQEGDSRYAAYIYPA